MIRLFIRQTKETKIIKGNSIYGNRVYLYLDDIRITMIYTKPGLPKELISTLMLKLMLMSADTVSRYSLFPEDTIELKVPRKIIKKEILDLVELSSYIRSRSRSLLREIKKEENLIFL